MRKKWDKEEINYLIQNFGNETNEKLASVLKKSTIGINCKAHKLNLKKTEEHKSRCISKRNKMIGRDLNKNLLTEIALKYKTKSEFQKSDPSAYSTSRKMGILEEICSHMIIQNFSIPQLILMDILEQLFSIKSIYNSRKIIPPYEIDVFFPSYNLGFEYNGKRWHKNNKNDDVKMKICMSKNINLIIINENNRNYETDIKYQIIYHLKKINRITGFNLSKNDVESIKITSFSNNLFDMKIIEDTISKYKTLKQFRILEPKIYQKLIKMKKLDILSSLKKERQTSGYTIDELKYKIKEYEYLLDFIQKSKKYYLYIHRHNLQYLLKDLKRKNVLISA